MLEFFYFILYVRVNNIHLLFSHFHLIHFGLSTTTPFTEVIIATKQFSDLVNSKELIRDYFLLVRQAINFIARSNSQSSHRKVF